jgi:hypothetical protein
MSYTIKADEKEGVIYLTIRDTITLEMAIESRQELAQLLQKTGIKKVLVDQLDGITDATVTDIYEFHSSHKDVFTDPVRIAMILSTEKEKFDNLKFAENVAINRGMAMRVFTEINDGLKWLRE